MRVTTLLILTFALGEAWFRVQRGNLNKPRLMLRSKQMLAEASAQDAATPDADATDASEDSDAGREPI